MAVCVQLEHRADVIGQRPVVHLGQAKQIVFEGARKVNPDILVALGHQRLGKRGITYLTPRATRTSFSVRAVSALHVNSAAVSRASRTRNPVPSLLFSREKANRAHWVVPRCRSRGEGVKYINPDKRVERPVLRLRLSRSSTFTRRLRLPDALKIYAAPGRVYFVCALCGEHTWQPPQRVLCGEHERVATDRLQCLKCGKWIDFDWEIAASAAEEALRLRRARQTRPSDESDPT